MLAAQVDSTLVKLDKLSWSDANKNNPITTNKILSGLSIEVDPNDLPLSVYVITQDQILLHGYNSIVDILATLPGIVTSQPGSGEDGEGFMMRGLYGNTYCKILINNNPIKPFVLKSMPLGQQLPIKNIERIEVVYGPSSSVYGVDASAGVINIITKGEIKSNLVQTSYQIGSNTFQNINAEFETSFNLLKRDFGLRIYGNSSTRSTSNVDYTENIDPLLYNLGDPNEIFDRENYVGTPEQPLINQLPSSSQLFGFEGEYGNLKFNYYLLKRKQHSSLGLSTNAFSYSNPLISTGEQITLINAEFNKKIKNFSSLTKLGYIGYRLDDRTSNIYVLPLEYEYLSAFILGNIEDFEEATQLNTKIYNDLYTGIRYSHGYSTEFFAEQRLQYDITKNISFLTAFRYETGSGLPIQRNLPQSVDESEASEEKFEALGESYSNLSVYMQGFLKYKKFRAILDANFANVSRITNLRDAVNFTPRVALMYELQSNIRIRSAYSSSLRTPSPYYNSTRVSVTQGSIPNNITFSPETTDSYTLGLNWQLKKKTILDIELYRTQTKNLINYGLSANFEEGEQFFLTAGFSNFEDSKKTLSGIQLILRTQDVFNDKKLDLEFSLNLSKGSEVVILDFGNDPVQVDLDNVRSYPTFISKFNLSYRPFTKFFIRSENSFQNSNIPLSLAGLYSTGELNNQRAAVKMNLIFRYQLNRYFGVSARITNLLNTNFGGIDATETNNVLLNNPQERRNYSLVVDYILR
jgi:outer membrane receptor for ferrienterochelin and colicin